MKAKRADEIAAERDLLNRSLSVQCKTGFGAARAVNRKVVHRVSWMTSACTEGRVRYFAGWLCGDWSWDVVIVPDLNSLGRPCKRCESIALGPFVYRCYNAAGQVLYIGSAKCRISRFQNHSATSPWWPDVARVDIEDQPDIEAARDAEAAAIAAERPIHNKQHNGKRFRFTGIKYMPVADAA